jgi:hypothetical protein
VLIVAAVTTGPVKVLLSLAPLRALGRISYGVYLYHWPVFLWLNGDRSGLSGGRLLLARGAVTIGIAVLSYHAVEMPIRTGRRLTGRAPWLVAPVAASALIAVLVLVTASPPQPAVVLAAVAHNASTPPTVPTGPAAPAVSSVLVVGDSIAQTLGRGVERWGTAHRVAVWNGGRYYCGVLRSGMIKVPTLVRSCDQWPIWSRQIAAFDPQVVVVLTSMWDTAARQWNAGEPFVVPGVGDFDDRFVEEYVRGIDLLSAGGARVVVLAPPCTANEVVSAQLAYERRHLLPRVARARPGVVDVVDVSERICPGGRYRSDPGGVADGRPDGVHFSDAGADWVAGWLMPRVVAGPAPDPSGRDVQAAGSTRSRIRSSRSSPIGSP